MIVPNIVWFKDKNIHQVSFEHYDQIFKTGRLFV